MRKEKEITRTCIFAAVFDVLFGVNILSKFETCEDDFYSTGSFAACTSGYISRDRILY